MSKAYNPENPGISMDAYMPQKVEDFEDGSSEYEFMGEEQEPEGDINFYANLAEDMSDAGRSKLSSTLLEAIEEDLDSRKDWMASVDKIKQYLGFSIEDLTNMPFRQASRTFDTTLSSALIRYYSIVRSELLPSNGPVSFKLNGADTEMLEAQGQKVTDWLNYYLTVVDDNYYADFERCILYLGLYGSAFKKVWYDPTLARPLSRFIIPADFIVDNDCINVIDSNRVTHVLHSSCRDIIINIKNKIYRDVELPYLATQEVGDSADDESNKSPFKEENIKLANRSKRSLFTIYEVHTYLNLNEFNESSGTKDEEKVIPLPYIVTIDKTTKEILSIRRNWKEQDAEQKRINYFIQYNYLPGFGVYGLGLAHIIGTNAITLTRLLRQLVDAGSYKNLPAGVRQKLSNQQQNDIIIGPGEFVPIDTGGTPLKDFFMPLPYSEPSVVLKELRQEIVMQTKELASIADTNLSDMSQNMPVGTTLAVMESNNRIQSAVLKSIHFSLTKEIQMLYTIFSETIGTEEFSGGSKMQTIGPEDFTKEIHVIPISDPSINSTTQRIMRAESLLKVAQTAPDLHNMREIYFRVYQAFGVQEIEEILKSDQSEQQVPILDPVTENMNAMNNKPLQAAIWQDHNAHIVVHAQFADTYPSLQAHIREHQAFQYLIEMQQKMGVELPPLDQLQDHDLQNQLAMQAAQVAEEPQNAQQQQIDPNQLLMAEIEQQKADIEAKKQIADLKAQVDILRAELDAKAKNAKIEADKEIAILRSETELAKINSQSNKETQYGI